MEDIKNKFIRFKYIESDMAKCEDGEPDMETILALKSDFVMEVGDKMLHLADINNICDFNDISEVEINLDIMIIKTKDFEKLFKNE